MPERDERWDDVSARMGEVQGWVPDDERPDDFIELLIEVRYDGQLFYNKQLVDKDDLADVEFNLINWLLDEMVEKMDESMKRWEETGLHA